jgi:hypothetical protein
MQRIPFLNGFHLKLIAICTMFIDHLGYTLFPGDLWLRCVGRVAFPIFCFLIAEGCVYTHDRRKYALRLLAFALLSEIPFNLMNSGAVWDRYHQNVLWTLLTGALVCWLLDWALKNRRALAFVLTALVMAAAFYLPERLNTDYGGWGMLLVVMFYGVHRAPGGAVSKMIAQALGLAFFSIASMGGYVSIELWSLVALVPIWLYRGRQGYHSKPFQYACYAFYPVHMLLLALVLNFVNR